MKYILLLTAAILTSCAVSTPFDGAVEKAEAGGSIAEPDSRKPIIGAFGIKLGDDFNSESSLITKIVRADRWGQTYEIIPDKLLEGFSRYHLSVDSKGRVLSIEASGRPESYIKARSLHQDMKALYAGHPSSLETEKLKIGEIFYFNIGGKRANTFISYTYWIDSDGLGWSLLYSHRALALERLSAQAAEIREKWKTEAENKYSDVL